jgi:hypothetical protein
MKAILYDLNIILNLLIKYFANYATIKNKRSIFVTASDEIHYLYLKELIKNFEEYNKKNTKDRLIVFNLGMTGNQLNELQKNNKIEVRDFSFQNFPKFYSQRLKEHNFKLGGFAWKPAILISLLNEKTDYLIWFDSANLFNKKILFFKIFIHFNGFISFYSSGNIKRWTHKNVIDNLNLQNNSSLLNSKNLTGGILGFDKTKSIIEDFLNDWNFLCSNRDNIFPKGSNIDNHRHDQALLTILYYLTFKSKLPNNSKFFGVSAQNWKNKIFYFYDLNKVNNKFSQIVSTHFLHRSTTTNSRSKLIILFHQSSLSKIPLKLFFTKKVILFVFNNNLRKNNLLKRYLTHQIYIDKEYNKSSEKQVGKIKYINFDENEILQILESEYSIVTSG